MSISELCVLADSPARISTIKLDAADQALARKVDFSADALGIVKRDLHAHLSLGPDKPYLTEQQSDDLAFKGRAAKLPEDVANFQHISTKYPELKPVIDALHEKDNPPRIDHSANEAALRQIIANGGPMPDFLKMFVRQSAPPKAMATIEAQFVDGAESQAALSETNKHLNDLGYNLTRVVRIESAPRFTTKAAALDFLKAHNTPASEASLVESKQDSFVAVYPVDWVHDFQTPSEQLAFVRQANLRNFYYRKSPEEFAAQEVAGMRKLAAGSARFLAREQQRVLFLPDGATVEKLADRRWKITCPARFLAKAKQCSALLVKIGDRSFAQTLADYSINYLRGGKVINDELVKAFERWDKAYGLTLIEPGADGPLLKFKSLPDNIDPLMVEIRDLSDEVLSPDQNANAAGARSAAAALRETHRVRLSLTGKKAVTQL